MLQYIINGGWALWVITAFSVVSLAVTFERFFTLRRARRDSEDLLERVSGHLDTGDIQGALELCHQREGPVAETIGIGLHKLLFLERVGKRPEEIEEGIVQAMEDNGGRVVEFLEKNLTVLATTASLGPILGMMGTVFGMIRAFGDVKAAGNMTPAAVAGGIAEALLCTAGGLIIAATGTLAYNYFSTKVMQFLVDVQAAAAGLVERVLEIQSRDLAK